MTDIAPLRARRLGRLLDTFNVACPVALAGLVAFSWATGIRPGGGNLLDALTFVATWAWFLLTPIAATVALWLRRGTRGRRSQLLHAIALVLWLTGACLVLFSPIGLR